LELPPIYVALSSVTVLRRSQFQKFHTTCKPTARWRGRDPVWSTITQFMGSHHAGVVTQGTINRAPRAKSHKRLHRCTRTRMTPFMRQARIATLNDKRAPHNIIAASPPTYSRALPPGDAVTPHQYLSTDRLHQWTRPTDSLHSSNTPLAPRGLSNTLAPRSIPGT
jgi:hypothetical protein